MAGVKIATVINSISELKIDKINVLDIDDVPDEFTVRDCPVLFPDTEGLVTGLSVSPQSLGIGTDGKNDVLYTLNYIYLHTPIGEGRYTADGLAGMIDNLALILNSLIANDTLTGSVDIEPKLSGDIGPMVGPSGVEFFGFKIAIDVREFYEV